MGHDLYTFIKDQAKELEAETIRVRQFLHENPELSAKEFETSSFLKKEVRKLGLIVEEVPESTGFTALIDTKKPGKTLGIRTDIDALPIEENSENLAGPRKYISKKPGVMHACGHDGHMAIVLSVIKILKAMEVELTGKIYFIFEEGEEIGSGIHAMLDHLQGKGIEAIYGNHLAAFMDSGTVAMDSGPVMAGIAAVDFTVHGSSGHGSRPDLSVNPVFAAAHILTALTNAWANRVDVTKTVTLGLTQIHGGSANNIIPDQVAIGGTLRFFDMKAGEKAVGMMKEVADLTARAHQCTVTFSEETKVLAPPLVNDIRLAKIARASSEAVMPGSVEEDVDWFASEPFSLYADISPIIFAFIGVRNEVYGSGAEHHNDRFDVDENALINGVLATTTFAVDFLNSR